MLLGKIIVYLALFGLGQAMLNNFQFNSHSNNYDKKYIVYVFLSESCPICQNITKELKDLHKEFAEKEFDFIGIMPNLSISNVESIKKFKNKYDLPFNLKLDREHSLTKELSATITPEVFVIRKSDNKILYSGKIDNSYERVGKRRTVVTEHYLKDALKSISNGVTPNPTYTKAVGCFINPSK